MLSHQQKTQFVQSGYLHLPGLISREATHAALRAINHSIGHVGKTGGDPARFTVDQFCYELTASPLMTDIFNSPVMVEVVENLIGTGNMDPVKGVQIAPRFPLPPGESPQPYHGHLDGIGVGFNGMDVGVYTRDFTLFAVVYLVDVPKPESGNFMVWPRSHLEFQAYFREVGHEVLRQGIPQIEHSQEGIMLTGKAGDVILAHHLLQHTAGHNISPHVRHALITRIRHKNLDAVGKRAFTDIWREWEGLEEQVRASV